ncbi:MAG: hypothetical protein WCJ58_03225 [bacterium]
MSKESIDPGAQKKLNKISASINKVAKSNTPDQNKLPLLLEAFKKAIGGL